MKFSLKKLGSVMIAMALLAPLAAGADERADIKLRASTTIDGRKASTTLKQKLEDQREKLKENIENRKEKLDQKKSEVEQKMDARFSEFISRVIERFNAATGRFDKIIL